MNQPLIRLPDPAKQARELLAVLTEQDGYEHYKFDKAQQLVKRVLEMEQSYEAKKIFLEQLSHADLNYLDTVGTLADDLAKPEEPIQVRIRDLMMVDHNSTVAAPAKVGKTTFLVNRIRTYVDGVPLFGSHELLTPLQGNVGLFNYELSERQMNDWFRRITITNADRVRVANLRGKGLFLQDERSCEAAIKWLKQHEIEIWEIDPLQAALRGSVIDDAVAAEWIQNAEMVKHEAGVRDMVLTVHMGHAASIKDADEASERAIGSARWMGWPDNMLTYVRNRDDNRNYLRATGRDIKVEEFGVEWDSTTYELTFKGGNRKDGIKSKIWTSLRNRLTAAKGPVPLDKLVRCEGDANKSSVRRVLDVLLDANLIETVTLPKTNPAQRGPAPKGYQLTSTGRVYITESVEVPREIIAKFDF